MNKIIRLGFTAIALALVLNVFAVAETKAQNVIGEILKRMEAHKNSLSSLKANIMMAKTDAVLGETDTYEGTTMYLPAKGRDALVRIDWVKPQPETLSVVNGTYALYQPRLKRVITGNAKTATKGGTPGSALDFMNMSKEQLKANYSIAYLGQENVGGSIPTWHLELTPKTENKFKTADLWVDGNGMVIQAKIVAQNNDSTTVFLSNLQKNVNIPANQFKLSLPKDVTVVKN